MINDTPFVVAIDSLCARNLHSERSVRSITQLSSVQVERNGPIVDILVDRLGV